MVLGATLLTLSSSCGGDDVAGVAGETTATQCQDGADNDGDVLTDCDDPDCQGYIFCAKRENTSALCQDKADNDGDGTIDCEDSGCADFTFCRKVEQSAAECQDQLDNDGDALTDCEDSDCQGFVFCAPQVEFTAAACQDKLDNDGDNKIDCEDSDCQGFLFCAAQVEFTAAACQDEIDNDGDTLTDCDDPDCQGYLFCQKTEDNLALCQDNQDNDGDNLTDCDDPDCEIFPACQEGAESSYDQCQDAVDNNGDQRVDCADPDCRHWYFCNTYNGYPTVDSWGALWDGVPRAAEDWDTAKDICESLGARLPTITELYRNNLTSGDKGVGTPQSTEYLWTIIATYGAGNYERVRLSDGVTDAEPKSTKTHFRCIWPKTLGPASDTFDKSRCYTAPGEDCFAVGQLWTMDTLERPTVTRVAAANECYFYGGSLPTLADYTEAVHGGLAGGSNNWIWAANAMYAYPNSLQFAMVRWNGKGPATWSYVESTYGTRT
ncbi:MAG: hypothetical protein JRH20_25925, partial [Deltaproteobacteria bacterium]|nr:hypothetical protein [Deltaproteobacteria bacterium]